MSANTTQRAHLDALIAELGTTVDRELASKYSTTGSFVAMLRKFLRVPPKRTIRVVPENIKAILGNMPDTHVAKLFDVSDSIVRVWRSELSIPVCQASHASRRRRELTPDEEHALRTMSLRDAGKVLGVTPERARQLKMRLEPLTGENDERA